MRPWVKKMKTPVCEADVKAGFLCASCKKKLSEGSLSSLDFELAQILFKVNERYNISNASFEHALDMGRVVLVLTKGEVGLLIGKQGKIVSELSDALGKKVRIAQISSDPKKTVGDVVLPARLLGINRVFHEGREVTKIRLAASDKGILPMDIPSVEKVLHTILEGEVKLVFE